MRVLVPKLFMSHAVVLGGREGGIPARNAVRIPHALTMDAAKPTNTQQAI